MERGITIHYDLGKGRRTPCGRLRKSVFVTGSASNVSCKVCLKYFRRKPKAGKRL